MQEIVPSSVSFGSSLKQLQLRLRVAQETCPSKDWLLAVEGSTEAQGQGAPAGSAVFGSYEHGAYDVTIRAKVRPETPGVVSLILYTLSTAAGSPSPLYEVHAVAPLLVAPNAAVQQEMDSVLDAMKAVVQQEMMQHAGVVQSSGELVADAAGKLTWSVHFQQLLWDMQAILACAAAKPGCLPAEVAAGVLTGVLEFLGHHGCWCSISWLLAEAIKARLLKHAKAAAAQRLQETQPFAGLGGTEAIGAMCAGFIIDLAASPTPPSHSSRTLYPTGSVARAGSPSTHTAYETVRSKHGSGCSDSSSNSHSSSSMSSAAAAWADACPPAAAALPCYGANQQPSKWRGWRCAMLTCHARNVVLVVTAACLVLLLLAMNSMQLLSCHGTAGQGHEQLAGCVLSHNPSLQRGPLGGALMDVLLHAPLMVLLLLAVSMASRVCLVL